MANGRNISLQTDQLAAPGIEKGNIAGILVFSLDITQRKRAEGDLAKRNEELTEIHEELQQNINELFPAGTGTF